MTDILGGGRSLAINGFPTLAPYICSAEVRHLKAPYRPESPSCQVPPLFLTLIFVQQNKGSHMRPKRHEFKISGCATCHDMSSYVFLEVYIFIHTSLVFFLAHFCRTKKSRFCINSCQLLLRCSGCRCQGRWEESTTNQESFAASGDPQILPMMMMMMLMMMMMMMMMKNPFER